MAEDHQQARAPLNPPRPHHRVREPARSGKDEGRGGRSLSATLGRWVGAWEAFFERHPRLRPVRRVTVAVVGTALILGGLAIGWLPGPGGFIGFIGLAMLAAEFRWVRKIVRSSQVVIAAAYSKLTGRHPNWALRLKKKMTPRKKTAPPSA